MEGLKEYMFWEGYNTDEYIKDFVLYLNSNYFLLDSNFNYSLISFIDGYIINKESK